MASTLSTEGLARASNWYLPPFLGWLPDLREREQRSGRSPEHQADTSVRL